MEPRLREYLNSDYQQCEALVNQAWGFDKMFTSQKLSSIAKLIYTKGSVLESNYKRVVEVNGQVAGFIFGLNERDKKSRGQLLFGLRMLLNIYLVRGARKEKNKLLNALHLHQKNRNKALNRRGSEIVLFVIGEDLRGQGVGTTLWTGFKNACATAGVTSILVEANKLGASRFYEKLGFVHLVSFHSPLHELATPDGRACMYEYKCQTHVGDA